MEEYEGIENRVPDACDAPRASNAKARTSTPGGQELELWSPAGEITHQKEVESEGNQLENAGVLRATIGNATKRLKSRVLTREEKSTEAAMRQFAAQERQIEKENMRGWKDKVMQEITRELHLIRQAHEEEMEAQRQGFQIELERVGGKVEQLELRAKTLENEVRALRSSGQQAARNPPPLAKAVAVSSSGTQDERAEKQTEDRRSEEESQKHQQARTQVTKTSAPNQPRQIQLPTSSPRKSYAQMAASINSTPGDNAKIDF